MPVGILAPTVRRYALDGRWAFTPPCGYSGAGGASWGAKVPTWPSATPFQGALRGRANRLGPSPWPMQCIVPAHPTDLPARCAGGTSAPGLRPPRLPGHFPSQARSGGGPPVAAPPTRALPWTHQVCHLDRGASAPNPDDYVARFFAFTQSDLGLSASGSAPPKCSAYWLV